MPQRDLYLQAFLMYWDSSSSTWLQTDYKLLDKVALLLPSLTIRTFPAGASIVFEGVSAGVTPLTVSGLTPNATYSLSVPPTYMGRSFVKWENGSTSPNRSIRIGIEDMVITGFYQGYEPTVEINWLLLLLLVGAIVTVKATEKEKGR